MLPGFEVTVYNVIGLPPLETGGVKLTVACALPAFAVTPPGAPGTVGDGALPQVVDAIMCGSAMPVFSHVWSMFTPSLARKEF